MSKVKKNVKNFKKKLTKKELEELALQEQVSDVGKEANSEAIAVDTSSLPHYADASNSTDTASSASSGETVSSGLGSSSTLWALSGLGIAGIAAAAVGGGSSGTSSALTSATSSGQATSLTLGSSTVSASSEKRLATITEDDGPNGYWDDTYVLTYDANGYLDAEVYTNTSNSEKSYLMDYINDQYGYVVQTTITRSDGTQDTTTYTRDGDHHAIKIEKDYDNDGTIDVTDIIEYDTNGNMVKYTETDYYLTEILEYDQSGYLIKDTIDYDDTFCSTCDEVIEVTYTFNADGKPTTINVDSTNNSNDDTIIITYNASNLLSTMQEKNDFITFTYDENGNLTQMESYSYGTVTFAWEDGIANGSAALMADFINNGAKTDYLTPVFTF